LRRQAAQPVAISIKQTEHPEGGCKIMSQRATCRCPLCQLERHVITRLEQEDSVRWFLSVAARTASLQVFQAIPELISYARSVGQDAAKRQVCDNIYIALMRELASPEHAELAQSLLLRMLAPGLHRELRGMMVVSFPGLDRDDLTQQLLIHCFEIMRSPGILRKTSYIAASIIEWTKRDTIRWAIGQYREADREETGIIVDDLFEAPQSMLFEAQIQLRDLLDKGVAEGLISPEDVSLLTSYEIEGMSGRELGTREGLDPKALSHRVRRAIERLNRAYQKSQKRTDDSRNESSE
jgi:DNA-directed RNA polymerase specialized sigma24 family protein